jgi:hypothetical protein
MQALLRTTRYDEVTLNFNRKVGGDNRSRLARYRRRHAQMHHLFYDEDGASLTMLHRA